MEEACEGVQEKQESLKQGGSEVAAELESRGVFIRWVDVEGQPVFMNKERLEVMGAVLRLAIARDRPVRPLQPDMVCSVVDNMCVSLFL
jgi:hypothetical protein